MKSLREADFSNHDVHKILAEAEQYNIDWLSDSKEKITERLRTPRTTTGFPTPWSKANSEGIRFREGELSVVGGYNGHRKSTLASQCALTVAKYAPVGICSLEEPIEDVGSRLIKQALVTDEPNPDQFDPFFNWAEKRIAVWDRLDSVAPAIALSAVYHMVGILGCKFVILDSLMMCDVCDDMERERRFVDQLTALAKMYSCHIMLVHHMRKPQDEANIPSKYDLLGASHISNMAQSIFVSWEDKKLRESKEYGEKSSKPDHIFKVAKQRYGTFEGQIGLYRNKGMTYSGHPNSRAEPMSFTEDL